MFNKENFDEDISKRKIEGDRSDLSYFAKLGAKILFGFVNVSLDNSSEM